MYFSPPRDRLIVVLTSGNLATTQEVLDNLRRDLAAAGRCRESGDGRRTFSRRRATWARYCAPWCSNMPSTLGSSGADARATLIVGGQIAGQPPEIYLVYPEGNYVAATWETPFLQLGEFKYGKPILSRLAGADLSLDDAARLALISFDAAMKSNLSVGTAGGTGNLSDRTSCIFSQHLTLDADSALLRRACAGAGTSKLTQAFRAAAADSNGNARIRRLNETARRPCHRDRRGARTGCVCRAARAARRAGAALSAGADHRCAGSGAGAGMDAALRPPAAAMI